jgi:hypothetical protein
LHARTQKTGKERLVTQRNKITRRAAVVASLAAAAGLATRAAFGQAAGESPRGAPRSRRGNDMTGKTRANAQAYDESARAKLRALSLRLAGLA